MKIKSNGFNAALRKSKPSLMVLEPRILFDGAAVATAAAAANASEPVPAQADKTAAAADAANTSTASDAQATSQPPSDSGSSQTNSSSNTTADTTTDPSADGSSQNSISTPVTEAANTATVTPVAEAMHVSVTVAASKDHIETGTPVVTGASTSSTATTDTSSTSAALAEFTAVNSATESLSGFGSYTVNTKGQWTYSVNDKNTSVKALQAGQTLTDSFSITQADGTETLISVSILGAQDSTITSQTATVQDTAQPTSPEQVIFIDTQSQYLPAIASAASAKVDVVWVDSSSSGLQAVSDYLSSHQQINSIVLVGASNGTDTMSLGSTQLDSTDIQNESSTLNTLNTQLAGLTSIEIVTSGNDVLAAAGTLSDALGTKVSIVDAADTLSNTWHLADLNNASANDQSTDIAFVDAHINRTLLTGSLPVATSEVVVLNPIQDGISQIASFTQGFSALSGIQIIASDAAGINSLGVTTLTKDVFSARATEFTNISHAVNQAGNVDVYEISNSSDSLATTTAQKLATFSGAEGTLEAQTLTLADPKIDGGYTEIVFIDSNISGWEQIAQSVRPGVGVVLINGQTDGLRSVADYLSNLENIDTVSIVSHGNQAELYMGTVDITGQTLGNYAGDLAAIGAAIKPSGAIQLYGCDVGQGDAGQNFLNQFSTEAGGVTVQASSNVTGAITAGGDWTLEMSTSGTTPRNVFDPTLVSQYTLDLGGSYSVTTGINVDTSGSTSGLIGAGKLITFDAINISAATTTAQLVLKAYDVDYGLLQSNGTPYAIGNANSEWDGVYIQKSGASTWQFVGYLNGTNNNWSSTTLDVTTFVKAQGSGNYIVRVVPDDNGTQTQANNGGKWVVGVSSAQMLIDGGSGTNTLTSISETNAAVSSNVTVATTGTYTVEYNLINSAGQDIASLVKTMPLTGGVVGGTPVAGNLVLNSNFYSSSATWSSVPSGAYTLQVTLVDASGAVQASGSLPYTIVAATSVPSSGLAAIVTGLDAASWTGTTVSDLQHTATSDAIPKIIGQLSKVASTTATTYVDVYADGAYVGTSSVAANSKDWTLQFGAASSAVNQSTKTLDIGNHVFSAVYSPTAVGSTSATYTAGGSSAVLDNAVSITGTTVPYKVIVSINSGVTGDTLSTSGAPTSLTSKFQISTSSTGIISFTAKSGQSPTVADFQALMRTITYSSTVSDPGNAGANLTRTISWQIQSTTNSSSYSAVKTTSVYLTVPTLAPTLTIASATINDYTNSGSIAANSGAVTITDNVKTLSAATVKITTGLNTSEDTLSFSNNSSSLYGNISGNYVTSTGILTLSSAGGSATLAQWQAALAVIKYTNSNTSTSRATTNRTITFQVDNGQTTNNTSSIISTTITTKATAQSSLPPSLLISGNATTVSTTSTPYIVNGSLVITDGDSTTFSSATVTDSSNSSNDTLSFTSNAAFGNITASTYDRSGSTGVLTLTSSGSTATLAQWQAALRSVTYSRASSTTSSRTMSFKLYDGTNYSNIAQTPISFAFSSSSANTFTTSTHTASNSPVNAIDIGSSTNVAQTTSFSSAAPTYTLLIDKASTIAPEILNIDGTAGVTTTTDRSPILSGTAAPGVSLQIKDGTTVIGSVTSNSDGTWSFSLFGVESLADGNYSFTVKDTVNGLTGTYALTVLSPLPTIAVSNIHISADTGSSTTDFITATSSQTITATLSATLPSGAYLQGSVDGGATWTDVTSRVSGTTVTWTSATLRSGYVDTNYDKYAIQFRVGNNSGFGSIAQQEYLLVSSLSTVSITAANYQSPSQPTLSGTADPAGIVTLTWVVSGVTKTGTAQPDVNGNWSFTVPNAMVDGVYTFTATETDPVTGATATGVSNTKIITINTSLPSISSVAISTDTGTDTTDVKTYTAAQTITATLSQALISGQALLGSVDGGQTWVDVTSMVSGTAIRWTGATLTGGITGGTQIDGTNQIEFQTIKSSSGAMGALSTLNYTLDSIAPLDSSAVLDPINNTVTLNFADTGTGLNTSVVPLASTFNITDDYNGGSANSANGGTTTNLTITSVAITSPTTLVLTFSGMTMTSLDSLTVGYTKPTTGNMLQDVAGNLVATFDPPVFNPISIQAVADTANATEAGGVNNASVGTNATGGLLANDAGSGLTVSKIDVGTVTVSSVVSLVGDANATTIAAGTTSLSGATAVIGTYGTLQIGSDGTYIYSVDNTNATVNALNVGQSVTDTFTYEAIDTNGNLSSATLTVTVKGANDNAVIGGTITGAVTEASGTNNAISGTPTVTGTLTAADVDNTANSFTAVGSSTSSTNGFGTYTIDATGHWSYTLDNSNAAVQALNVGRSLTDTFTVSSIDGTNQTVTITINGANDTSVISGTTTGAVTEASGVSNAITGTPTATGTLTNTDIDNPANTFTAVSSATASTSGYGTYTIDASGHWSYTVDNANASVQALNVGGTLTDHFTVASADGTQQIVTITINGANDAAVIGGTDSGAVTEASGVNNAIAGTPTVTGTLTSADVDNTVNAFTAVGSSTASTSGYGTYTIDASGHWSYTLDNSNTTVQALNVGQTLTDHFTITSADNTQKIVTITINGADDAPVASVMAGGSVTEGSALTPIVVPAFTDIDNTAGQITYTALAYDSVHSTWTSLPSWLTFTSATRTLSGTAPGATAGVYTIQVTGADAGGQSASGTFDLTVVAYGTVLATNDVASASEASGINNLTAGTNPTGNVLANDTGADPLASTPITMKVDQVAAGNSLAASTAVSTTTVEVAGTYGTLQINPDGSYTYVVDNTNTTVNALNSNSTPLTDTFTYEAKNSIGNFSTASLTVSIHGANDAAIISGTIAGDVTEASGVSNATPGTPTVTGTLTNTDVDNTANSYTAVSTDTTSTGGYGTYRIDGSGNWSYTLDNTNATVQALNVGNTLADHFTVTTIDGTQQIVTITINGANDAAVVAGTTTGSVTEASGVNNAITGTPTTTGTMTSSDVDNVANTFIAVTSAANSTNGYGTFTIDASGHWSYTIDNSNATVQALNIGDALTDTFITHTADGTAQTVTITINGANDAASVGGVYAGDVTEASGVNNASPGMPTASGTLTSSDIDNATNTFHPVLAATLSVNGYGSYTIDAAGNWNYTLDDANTTVDRLNVGDSLTDSFVVTSVDGTAKTVTITIHGANDAAAISGTSSGSVTEASGVANATAGIPTATGSLTSSDADNSSAFTVTNSHVSTNGYGSYSVDASGNWTYTLDDSNATVQSLNVGQAVNDRFDVRSIDGTIQTVLITIRGANDAAVFSGNTTGSTIAASAGQSGTPIATGTITDADPDNTANTFIPVTTATLSANAYGNYTIDSSGHWEFTLDNTNASVHALTTGSTLTDTFTVSSEDGSTKTITITINPANNVISSLGGDTFGSVTEAGGFQNGNPGSPAVSGRLTDTDPDGTKNSFVAASSISDQGYGSFSMSSDGLWTFTLNNNNATVQALNTGGVILDTFTVRTAGGQTQVITISINGANDAAQVSGDTSAVIDRSNDPIVTSAPSVSGALTSADVDNPNNTFQPVYRATVSTMGYGNYTLGSDGHWTYTLNNGNTAVQSLQPGEALSDSFVVRTIDGTEKVITIRITNNTLVSTTALQSRVPEAQINQQQSIHIFTPTTGVITSAETVSTRDTEVANINKSTSNIIVDTQSSDPDLNSLVRKQTVFSASGEGEIATRQQFVFASSVTALQKGPEALPPPTNNSSSRTIDGRQTNDNASDATKVGSGLRNILTPPDIMTPTNGLINFEIPNNTFVGGVGKNTLTATMPDGSPIPSWMTFNGESGKLTGTAPSDSKAPLEIKIEATDSAGDKASTTIKIQPPPAVTGFIGKQSLTAQLKMAQRRAA